MIEVNGGDELVAVVIGSDSYFANKQTLKLPSSKMDADDIDDHVPVINQFSAY